MCRYTHCVNVYPLGGVWVNQEPQFAFDASLGGGFRQTIAVTFGTKKLEWCGYPMVKKNLKISFFVLTECMYERDRHTGRQTDGHGITAKAALA